VIGINTAIASPSGGNVGVGFAIPIDMARRIMDQLIDDGSISRGYLGVMIQDLDDALAGALGLEQTRGALVGDVTAGGPADEAGLRRGDVIVRFDGDEVIDTLGLRNAVAAVDPGTRVDLDVIRDGRTSTLTVRLGERPSGGNAMLKGQGSNPGTTRQRLGLEVQDLTAELASHLGYEGAEGALVTGVESGGPADDAGLRRGDLIVEADKQPVGSAADLGRIVTESKADRAIVLLARRGPNTFFVAVEPEED
jgi:serine protease Do